MELVVMSAPFRIREMQTYNTSLCPSILAAHQGNICLLPSHWNLGGSGGTSLVLFLFVSWPLPLGLHRVSVLEDFLSPWEPPIKKKGTPVVAREIGILGMSELK